MQICEEYLKRHSITGVSLFKHASQGYLFIREPCDVGFRWTVLSIYWNEPGAHPGYYTIRFTKPIHDAQTAKQQLLVPDTRLGWDLYEDFLHNWSFKCKKQYVVSVEQEVTLAAWEMFVYSYDKYLARNFHGLSGLLCKTLDYSTSIRSRYSSYLCLLECVDMGSTPFKYWRETIQIYSQNYSYWLADLVRLNGR